MQLFKKSLIFNLSVAIILVEIIALTLLGLFYTERFFSEVDKRTEASVRLPGDLMNHQLLRYESVSDAEVMTHLVGEEFIDGMVLGLDGRIYYASKQNLIGQSAFDLHTIGTDLLSTMDIQKTHIIRKADNTIVAISPLLAFKGAKPFFLVYVKASTLNGQTRKQNIAAIFIFGSISCVILTSLAIIGYSRKLVTKPLERLKESADSLRRGDKGINLESDRVDEIGALTSSFASMHEAIELKIDELEEANRISSEREQKLDAFINAMPDMVLLLDNEGRYQEIYAPQKELLFLSADELKGKLIHDVMPQRTADQCLDAIHRSIETGSVQSLEYALDTPSGPRWFEARVASIGDKSGFLGSAWVIRDISYRKEYEDRLTYAKEEAERVSARLRELDQTKSTLVSSVSHELRTPLTSLLGFSKLILKNFAKNFWPLAKGDHKLLTKGAQIVENLNILIHEGNRLTRLINDVLDLNKIEMGYTEWREIQVSPAELAQRAAKAASGQFDSNPRLTLVTNIDSTLPDILADPDRIIQVLLNLLSNAAKFTPEGIVTLSATRTEEGMLRYEVSDTGPGIDEQEQERIFDVFHQISDIDPASDKPSGTGLGLAISRDIVAHHNGTIWVESELGRGSTFIIEMPYSRRLGSGQLS